MCIVIICFPVDDVINFENKLSFFLSRFPMSVPNSVCLVPSWVSCVSCHRVTVLSWVQNFSPGYFVGPKYFLAGISWVQSFYSLVFRGYRFFSCLFRGSEVFSHRYFLGLKLFLVGISWVQNFFSWVFRGSEIFSR